VKAEYLTGTALTIIVVLFVLPVPHGHSRERCPKPTQHCRVCDGVLDRPGRYCPACGSRISQSRIVEQR